MTHQLSFDTAAKEHAEDKRPPAATHVLSCPNWNQDAEGLCTSAFPETIEVLKNKKLVISLGGGAFMSKKIRSEVKKLSISFWLDVSSNILIKRLSRTKKRPLLYNKNLSETVNKIYLERKTTYSEADFRIRCNTMRPSVITNKILKLYESSTNKI